jgi:hypothetical protein
VGKSIEHDEGGADFAGGAADGPRRAPRCAHLAAVYLAIGAISDLETALYFSTVTFTTLGYGDLTLDASWRLLSALQAANGTIMFGWTTAIVMAAIQRMVVRREAASA